MTAHVCCPSADAGPARFRLAARRAAERRHFPHRYAVVALRRAICVGASLRQSSVQRLARAKAKPGRTDRCEELCWFAILLSLTTRWFGSPSSPGEAGAGEGMRAVASSTPAHCLRAALLHHAAEPQ